MLFSLFSLWPPCFAGDILSVEMFWHILLASRLPFEKKKKKYMVSKTALLFISDCHPSALLLALPKALLCFWCTACGSLLSDPGLYIGSRGALRVQSFHSTSERFPRYRRCSSAHHQSPPRPQCGFWMELRKLGGGWHFARGWVRGPANQASGLCTSTVFGVEAPTYVWSRAVWTFDFAVRSLWKNPKSNLHR